MKNDVDLKEKVKSKRPKGINDYDKGGEFTTKKMLLLRIPLVYVEKIQRTFGFSYVAS